MHEIKEMLLDISLEIVNKHNILYITLESSTTHTLYV
jgi:hypothetical protein